MRQPTLSDNGFEKFRKKTRKEQFLAEMEVIIPWHDLTQAIEPFYPQPEGAGRRPIGIERMLRIHFLQHWFNLSDPAVEEACMTRAPCASLSALIWAGNRCRMKLRCVNSAI